MKKFLVLLMVLLALVFAFVGCSKNDNPDTPDNPETTSDIWGDDDWWQESTTDNTDVNVQEDQNQDVQLPTVDNNNNVDYNNQQTTTPTFPDYNNNQNNNNNTNNTPETTKPSTSLPSNSLISDEDMAKLEQSQAEVFFSDNPNNKYIVRVVNRYGVDASNLVALIKVNATFPSAMVLEFSGKRDANGELVMTYSELKYVYNIDESNNSLVRASKTGAGNDGVSFVESKIMFTLMEKYFCPELPNLKANKRYD